MERSFNMAEIKAFKGVRYADKAGDINSLTCPPYDIISDSEREEYIRRNPYNIIRLELPKEGGEDRYKEAGKLLNKWLDEGALLRDEKDGLYIYEMSFTANGKKGSLKGFVTLVKLEEFSAGVILPHEETLSKAKTDRFNLMSETDANFSQIYSLYSDADGSVSAMLEKASKGAPDIESRDPDGTLHRMWHVSDEAFAAGMSSAFTDKKLYIADGHHRYETALNYHKSLLAAGKNAGDGGYVMMMLVNMENDGLVVFPTHRIVRNLDGFDAETLIERCREYFDISKTENEDSLNAELDRLYGEGKKAFGMYFGGGNCVIMSLNNESAVRELLPGASEAYCGLDVSVLHSLVLERIFGIDKENMANQKNLIYTRSAKEAMEAVDSEQADCAFILNPTKVSEIRDVAAAGEKMPQKSTYFYPKLITGLVINKF